MIGVVLDTNVLVSANVTAEGLEALVVSLAFSQQVRCYVSEPILGEYERVLRYPRLKFLTAGVDLFLAKVHQVGVVVIPTHTLKECPDEPDNRFLECAEEAKADFLITGNKRHFPNRWKTTLVLNAREFLDLMTSTS
jgi:putative PIN family toxin of toxin-antitoxin system